MARIATYDYDSDEDAKDTKIAKLEFFASHVFDMNPFELVFYDSKNDEVYPGVEVDRSFKDRVLITSYDEYTEATELGIRAALPVFLRELWLTIEKRTLKVAVMVYFHNSLTAFNLEAGRHEQW